MMTMIETTSKLYLISSLKMIMVMVVMVMMVRMMEMMVKMIETMTKLNLISSLAIGVSQA